jgi:hypothetical protein
MKKLASAQHAIKQAIEGGYDVRWNPAWLNVEKIDSQGNVTPLKNDQVFTDPLFWQALGKARGWELHTCTDCNNPDSKCNCNEKDFEALQNTWNVWAMRWFYTRLSNGDEEKFWQSLP